MQGTGRTLTLQDFEQRSDRIKLSFKRTMLGIVWKIGKRRPAQRLLRLCRAEMFVAWVRVGPVLSRACIPDLV